MQWAEAALGLASLCGDLNPEDLLRLFLLMQLFKTWNLSWIQFRLTYFLSSLQALDYMLFFYTESFGIWIKSCQ